jgi:hypothetical protein
MPRPAEKPLEGQGTLPGFEGLPVRLPPEKSQDEPRRPRRRHRRNLLLLDIPAIRRPLDAKGQVVAAREALAQARQRHLAPDLMREAEKRVRLALKRLRATLVR